MLSRPADLSTPPSCLHGAARAAAGAACGGAFVGLACGTQDAWPLAIGGVAVLSATAIASSMKHQWRSVLVVASGVAAWQTMATGWVVLAVRQDQAHSWAWQAAVVFLVVGHHVVIATTTWAALRWAFLRSSPGREMTPLHHAASFALAWMSAEVLRQWGWAGNGYGNPVIPMVDAPGIDRLLPLVGAQGASFLMVAACSAWTVLALRPRNAQERSTWRWLAAASALLLACPALLPAPSRWTQERPESLDIMALEVPPPLRGRDWSAAEREAALIQLHSALDEAKPHTTIVTPETFFGDPPPSKELGHWGDLLDRIRHKQVTVLVNMPQVVRNEDGMHLMNTVQQLSPDRRALYAKERLVPGAEYLPWASVMRPVYQRVFDGVHRSELPGRGPMTSSLYVEGAELGLTICHELAYPETVAARARGADALLNITDDSWIPNGRFHQQMQSTARARALETGRPLLRVSRGNPSILVDHLGAARRGTTEPRGRWTRFALATRAGETPYARLAPAIAMAPVALSGGLLMWAALRGRRAGPRSQLLAPRS